jgi:1-hydroxycarotenoid 3,4-desaturase
MNRLPVVVVGAGFGGLAAAVRLAACGETVVVVERELRPGGKARAVHVSGRSIDVGPTVLTMRWVFDALFALAGDRLDDAVSLSTPDVIARHAFADGQTLDLYSEVERTAGAITQFAGAREADGYRRFAAHSAAIAETVRGPFLTSERPSITGMLMQAGKLGLGALGRVDAHRTMWASLSSFFDDPRLRQIFARYATYVGSSPFEAPGTFNLIAHVEREGVAVVRGGMSRLADALATLAAGMGVTFQYGSRVREIVTAEGRAAGVLVEDATGRRELVAARAVIANADVSVLAGGAFGAAAAGAVKIVPPERRSLSALTWAVVGEAAGLRLEHHNVFFSRNYPAEMHALFGERRLPEEPTVYVCAQDRIPDATAPERGDSERFLMIVNAPAVADRAPLTAEEVERCERSMLSVLARTGLTLTPRATVVTTPSSFEQIAPGTGGAIYGEAAHGPFSPLSRPSSRTRLPGLYLAGGSVHPGPGVPMAALSGGHAAQAVVSDLASTVRWPQAAIAGFTSTG